MYEFTLEERKVIDTMYANEYVAIHFMDKLSAKEKLDNKNEYSKLRKEYERLDIYEKYKRRFNSVGC